MKINKNEKLSCVHGFENLYIITNEGRLWSIKRNMFLKPSKGIYFTITLFNRDKKRSTSIHRLVAEHFIENSENKAYVNHIDGDKHNNNVSNLEWVTPSENDIHAFKNGFRKPSEKQKEWAKNHAKTLCKSTRKKINQKTKEGEIVKTYNSIREAAREMCVSHQSLMEASKRDGISCGFKWEVL